MQNYLSYIIAFSVTVATIVFLKPLATRLGLVDNPGGRKKHAGSVPLIGGIAMFCGFCFAILTLPISLSQLRSFLAAALFLIIVGILDDFHELHHRQKFIAQILAAAIIMFWGNTTLYNLGNLVFLGDVQLGWFGLPLTIIAMVGLINAVNMLDGLDGLAGALTLTQVLCFYLIASSAHLILDQEVLLLIIAILLAFLCFNFPGRQQVPHKVFMGDAGSMLLGLILSWFSIRLTQAPLYAAPPVTMLWICAVPLLDTVTAIARRLYKKQSPFRADNLHFHHLIHQAGYSNLQTVLLLTTLSLICGIVGLLSNYWQIPQGIMFIAFLAIFVIYLSILITVLRTPSEKLRNIGNR